MLKSNPWTYFSADATYLQFFLCFHFHVKKKNNNQRKVSKKAALPTETGFGTHDDVAAFR